MLLNEPSLKSTAYRFVWGTCTQASGSNLPRMVWSSEYRKNSNLIMEANHILVCLIRVPFELYDTPLPTTPLCDGVHCMFTHSKHFGYSASAGCQLVA
ncbi:hypothetical protein AG1IA_05223 [Rhizoctonia solani AG-1 IA]|uniref:Uncharacterized protein n=1 Tax=Thanatephorus cucumeris (strain AG1-IA) TaxID=983506 RepID=L8WS49_THACA|nr:hypothetical protein AG1IA_05223 [Rhizoctonia solani AG-1 IA]